MASKPTYEELRRRVKALEKEAAKSKAAEEALRVSEKRLSEIMDESSIPTFVIDRDHVITHYNRAMENLTGTSANEIIGTRKQWMAFYAEERPILADLVVDNASGDEIARLYGIKCRKSEVIEGAYEAEDFFPDLGERGRWLFFTAAPLRDAEGRVTGAIETLQDISQRKQAEEAHLKAERLYRTLLDFAPYPIVVFTVDGRVSYLNPAFTEIFGWTFEELEGQRIPYVPQELQQETTENIKKLFEEKIILRHETKRLTKDRRTLDVVMRAAVFSEDEDEPAGELVILRDVTEQNRIARNNEAMLRISMALPEHPDLEELLDYISSEVIRLLDTEGAVVVLLDEQRQEIFFPGVAYDDTITQKRVKEVRLPIEQMDQVVAGKGARLGEPVIVNDTSTVDGSYPIRDEKLGYETRSFLQVPLKSGDRIIGFLTAINKKEGIFQQRDVELLNTIGGTVALSIENARFSEELKQAYREVSSLNRAKDKVINHLSHELKTPISVLYGSFRILAKKLAELPEESWKPTLVRAQRNLQRILDIQHQTDDIMRERQYKAYDLLSLILEECADELEVLIAEEVGEGPVIGRVRERVEEIFAPKQIIPESIKLDAYVKQRLEHLEASFSHRQVEIRSRLKQTPPAYVPREVLQKVIDGLVRNAVENTPDQGKMEIVVHKRGIGSEIIVRDYGVGITEEHQSRIFEGFFTTRETMDYSTKRPFDFMAGGRGADLLRMKIFSERYNFRIDMKSSRCGFIPQTSDICPGRISECDFCRTEEDCYESGGTTFFLYFPPASDVS
ncbi:MAG: PAS domain S-box protein [Desulfobacteraceae bacterium]|jgi:PAS domain S-box-containing protein